MPCEEIQLTDGTWFRVQLVPGKKLTDRDRKALAEFAMFCREHAVDAPKMTAAIKRIRARAGKK